MTQDIEDHLRKLSSRHGRYWLRDMQNAQTAAGVALPVEPKATDSLEDQLPFTSVAKVSSTCAVHESVVVSIPDVGVEKKRPSRARVAAGQLKEVKHSKIIAPIPVVEPVKSDVVPPVEETNDVVPPVEPTSDHVSDHSGSAPFQNSANVADGDTSRSEGDDAIRASRSGQTIETMDSIAKIANSIVDEFPVASSSLIAFVGTQVGLHTDETCARVAAELGGKGLGRVLLVDSDFGNRRLSKASGMNSQAGLSEVMNIAFDWRKAILKSGSSQLDFMPAGNCPHKRWTPIRTLKEALAEMKSEYQFICVSGGDAHEAAASMWAGLSDGAMLLVSAANSNDSIAKSAVAQLRKDGARIFGCVVTDANESIA